MPIIQCDLLFQHAPVVPSIARFSNCLQMKNRIHQTPRFINHLMRFVCCHCPRRKGIRSSRVNQKSTAIPECSPHTCESQVPLPRSDPCVVSTRGPIIRGKSPISTRFSLQTRSNRSNFPDWSVKKPIVDEMCVTVLKHSWSKIMGQELESYKDYQQDHPHSSSVVMFYDLFYQILFTKAPELRFLFKVWDLLAFLCSQWRSVE